MRLSKGNRILKTAIKGSYKEIKDMGKSQRTRKRRNLRRMAISRVGKDALTASNRKPNF